MLETEYRFGPECIYRTRGTRTSRRKSGDNGRYSVISLIRQLCVVLCLFGTSATAQNATPASAGTFEAPTVGPETNLPLPRFVSLKASEVNVRRGPSLSHRIDWVFQRRSMPLQVIGEYGHWRRVIDREGQGGWVHYTMLSGARSVIVDQDLLRLRARPWTDSRETVELEAGVIARLHECELEWCRLSAGGYKGWALKTVLWGVEPDEVRD